MNISINNHHREFYYKKYHQEYGTNDASVKDIAFVRKHYIPKGGTKIHPAMKKQKKIIPCGGTKFCLKRTDSEGNSEGDLEVL